MTMMSAEVVSGLYLSLLRQRARLSARFSREKDLNPKDLNLI